MKLYNIHAYLSLGYVERLIHIEYYINIHYDNRPIRYYNLDCLLDLY